jgi:hypothetical protein
VQTDQDKRIQDLESEEESLSTALRILQQDLVNTEQNKWTTVKTKQNKTKQRPRYLPNQLQLIQVTSIPSLLTAIQKRTIFQSNNVQQPAHKQKDNDQASTSKEASHESRKAKQRNTDHGQTRHKNRSNFEQSGQRKQN